MVGLYDGSTRWPSHDEETGVRVVSLLHRALIMIIITRMIILTRMLMCERMNTN